MPSALASAVGPAGASGSPDWLPWFAAALVFATFTIANALVWEPAHDEGVTWTQAFGAPDVARCGATRATSAATSIASLYPALDAGLPRSSGDVVAALVRDGMHPPAYYLLVNGAPQGVLDGYAARGQ